MRIATRSSPLAMWAAQSVAAALSANGLPSVDVELVPVSTSGDLDQVTPMSQMSGRGVFVTEVQAAVLDGRADIAVHSAKDMRSEPTPGLRLAGCLERGDARDALVGLELDAIPLGGVVATGSQRRLCQLSALREDLRFAGLRGNMARRVAAASRADIDAVVVAVAALQRLGEAHQIAQRFSHDEMVPQVGQGAIAIEHRSGDTATAAAVSEIVDDVTTRCVHAERAFLLTLGGGCDLPTGAYATVNPDGSVNMAAMLATPDRTRIARVAGSDRDGEQLGVSLARQLIASTGTAASYVTDAQDSATPKTQPEEGQAKDA